jgi:hypothetical protein
MKLHIKDYCSDPFRLGAEGMVRVGVHMKQVIVPRLTLIFARVLNFV